MQRLNLTLPTPAENVALDEALLDWAEEEATNGEVFRLWESPQPMVVAGRSSRVALEINVAECERKNIPIIRRSSGGATIVTGPGCLMYAVVLSYKARPELRDIGRAHAFVLDRIIESIKPLLTDTQLVARKGTSDLVLVDSAAAQTVCKFSGNSLRAKRNHFLYHGTLLYDFDLALITSCLNMPPRQPDYRGARPHADFVTNLPLSREQLMNALNTAWPSPSELKDVPMTRVADLMAARFGRDEWNREFA
jgi:lipoate---protein ligase